MRSQLFALTLGLLGVVVSIDSTFAGASAATERASAQGIVTPDVAEAATRHENYTHDAGGFVVCLDAQYRSRSCSDAKIKLPVRQAVPAGKTYVGFRLVTVYSNTSALEIYWK